MTLDALDSQLIAALRHDARQPVAALALKLGVSRGTVTNRMEKLERDGIISGYTVRVRPDATPDQVRCWTMLSVEGNQQGVTRLLLGEPGVVALYDTNGRWDLLAELQVTDLAELSRVLERIRRIPGVTFTETNLHLRTFRG